jgi:glycosyltransferase involved in cell wall biosynthesis
MKSHPNLMRNQIVVLDTATTGHHYEFLKHLIDACRRYIDEQTVFQLFVHERLAREFESSNERVMCTPISEGLPHSVLPLKFALSSVCRTEGEISLLLPRMNGYIQELLAADHSESLWPRVSGIWFGPQSAAWVYGGSLERRLRGLLELYRIRRLRNRSNLQRLYILNDERTARFIQKWVKLPGGVIPLSDPVDTLPETTVDYREKHGIPGDAIVFGLIGAHRSGKGVQEALATIAEWKPNTDKPVVLLLAGECLPAFEEELQSSLSEWESEEREVRLVTDLRFFPREELAACFTCSDYLLMPYRNVYGSSGILGHAARYRKPVLASEGGLIGHLARAYGLGHTFNPADGKAFLEALDKAISGKVSQDESGAGRYLKVNSIESFQQTLLEKEFTQ